MFAIMANHPPIFFHSVLTLLLHVSLLIAISASGSSSSAGGSHLFHSQHHLLLFENLLLAPQLKVCHSFSVVLSDP